MRVPSLLVVTAVAAGVSAAVDASGLPAGAAATQAATKVPVAVIAERRKNWRRVTFLDSIRLSPLCSSGPSTFIRAGADLSLWDAVTSLIAPGGGWHNVGTLRFKASG